MVNFQQVNQNQPQQVPFEDINHNLSNIKPTSSEINYLWITYTAECMSVAMLKHMVAKSQDPDFHNVLQLALDVSSQNIIAIEEIFNSIHHPVPDAFGEKDVDVNAPELFSEIFSVRYSKHMSRFILVNHTLAFSDSSRTDIKDLFSRAIERSKGVIQKADQVLLAKGLFSKSPNIEIPDSVEYVHDKSYYGSFFGKSDRPLNVVGISNIFNILDFKMAMRALKQGFAQVAKSDQVRNHLNRGLKMADKQKEILGSLLEKENLPEPEIINNLITDSTQSPYSDRLIMFHTSIAMARIILAYGIGLTNTSRKDVVADFTRLMIEILEFSKDGTDIMIENGWLEQVPLTINREKLTH
ncbi:DUF3231 family protein [Desulfosporosinus nitroreducens]|uniref:DUF3231 family protein n=1 Tax=Desulfosporosinus nitroreducens TaxID=2018668 RepID=A0ABT8QTE5_9FIRM|nr:DUF3231 family protein [Desulfosporosinus nitroreducens]MDO0824636.1 DUF3231 family protein [Desulfosporosinus nitroreducens]